MRLHNFFAELKRRNVYKVAVAYIVAGWALSQGIAQVFPVFDVPNWLIRLIVLLIIIGLPIALVLAWMFELTPEGIKRTATADAMPRRDPKEEIRLDLRGRDRRCDFDRLVLPRAVYRDEYCQCGSHRGGYSSVEIDRGATIRQSQPRSRQRLLR